MGGYAESFFTIGENKRLSPLIASACSRVSTDSCIFFSSCHDCIEDISSEQQALHFWTCLRPVGVIVLFEYVLTDCAMRVLLQILFLATKFKWVLYYSSTVPEGLLVFWLESKRKSMS